MLNSRLKLPLYPINILNGYSRKKKLTLFHVPNKSFSLNPYTKTKMYSKKGNKLKLQGEKL